MLMSARPSSFAKAGADLVSLKQPEPVRGSVHLRVTGCQPEGRTASGERHADAICESGRSPGLHPPQGRHAAGSVGGFRVGIHLLRFVPLSAFPSRSVGA